MTERPTTHRTEIWHISPERARQMLAEYHFDGQRPVARQHVEFLRRVAEQGRFDSGAPLRIGVLDDRWLLLDGRHRLSAIAAGSVAFRLPVILTECNSMEEARAIYSRIDRGRGRSLGEAMRGLGMQEQSGLTETQFRLTAACLPLLGTGLAKANIAGAEISSRSAEQRADLMLEWAIGARLFFAATAGANNSHFNRREVMAVALVTLIDMPARELAAQFWRTAAMDDGLRANDPRKTLLTFLHSTPPSKSGIGRLAHGVAHCWNTWFRGGTLTLVRVTNESAPVRILGTRFARRDVRENADD